MYRPQWVRCIVGCLLFCGGIGAAVAGCPTAHLNYSIYNASSTTWNMKELGMPGISSTKPVPATLAPGAKWSTTFSLQSHCADQYMANLNSPNRGLYTISLSSGTTSILVWPLTEEWMLQEAAATEAQLPKITGTITYYPPQRAPPFYYPVYQPVENCTTVDPLFGLPVCSQDVDGYSSTDFLSVPWSQMETSAYRNYGSLFAGTWEIQLSETAAIDLTISNPS